MPCPGAAISSVTLPANCNRSRSYRGPVPPLVAAGHLVLAKRPSSKSGCYV